MSTNENFSLFDRSRFLARGTREDCLKAARTFLADGGHEPLLFFDEKTGRQYDFDLRENPPEKNGPGRPKLGVQNREISLLPKHWDWLESQGSSASAGIRNLVDRAMKDPAQAMGGRSTALSRIITAVGGDLPGAEEVHRALFAQRWGDVETLVEKWPQALGDYIRNFLKSEDA